MNYRCWRHDKVRPNPAFQCGAGWGQCQTLNGWWEVQSSKAVDTRWIWSLALAKVDKGDQAKDAESALLTFQWIFVWPPKKNLAKTNKKAWAQSGSKVLRKMVTSHGQLVLVNSSPVFTSSSSPAPQFPIIGQSIGPSIVLSFWAAATVLGNSDPPVQLLQLLMLMLFSATVQHHFWRCTTTHLLALPLLVQESPAGAVCTRSTLLVQESWCSKTVTKATYCTRLLPPGPPRGERNQLKNSFRRECWTNFWTDCCVGEIEEWTSVSSYIVNYCEGEVGQRATWWKNAPVKAEWWRRRRRWRSGGSRLSGPSWRWTRAASIASEWARPAWIRCSPLNPTLRSRRTRKWSSMLRSRWRGRRRRRVWWTGTRNQESERSWTCLWRRQGRPRAAGRRDETGFVWWQQWEGSRLTVAGGFSWRTATGECSTVRRTWRPSWEGSMWFAAQVRRVRRRTQLQANGSLGGRPWRRSFSTAKTTTRFWPWRTEET